MAIKTDTVPQLFNLALATSVIVTVGDAVQDLIEKLNSATLSGSETAVRAALLIYLLLWGTKVFVDDNEVFREGKTIHPGLDLVLLVLSYSFLFSAAAALTSDYFLVLLACHFVTLIVWVALSYAVERLSKEGPRSDAPADYRDIWWRIDLVSVAALVVVIFNRESLTWWWVGTAVLFGCLACDVCGSETLTRRKLIGPDLEPQTKPHRKEAK